MSVELKIKSKHLSVEAQIIRFEERKFHKQYRWAEAKYRETGNNDMYPRWSDIAFMKYCSLSNHRKWDVRNENRATFLARAYIEGAAYSSIEQKRKPENEYKFNTYVLPRVVAMVAKYGKNKMESKTYDRVARAYVDNPELVGLKKDIISWSTTSEARN
jgi:hypothetical protein